MTRNLDLDEFMPLLDEMFSRRNVRLASQANENVRNLRIKTPPQCLRVLLFHNLDLNEYMPLLDEMSSRRNVRLASQANETFSDDVLD